MHLTPDDEITSGEDLISLDEVRARIAVLKPYTAEPADGSDPDGPVQAFADREDAEAYAAEADGEDAAEALEVVTADDAAEELGELRTLETAMNPLHYPGGRADAINDGYLETLTRDEIEGLVGTDAIAVLGEYVDWARLVRDRQANMTGHVFRGERYWLAT
jgi:hypothetical protein